MPSFGWRNSRFSLFRQLMLKKACVILAENTSLTVPAPQSIRNPHSAFSKVCWISFISLKALLAC